MSVFLCLKFDCLTRSEVVYIKGNVRGEGSCPFESNSTQSLTLSSGTVIKLEVSSLKNAHTSGNLSQPSFIIF